MLSTTTLSFIDIGRVLVLIATLAYASKLDIKNRRVPHKTWIIPVLFGCLFISLQLYQAPIPSTAAIPELFTFGYLSLAFASVIGLVISGFDAYNNRETSSLVWAIPLIFTLTFLLLQVVFNAADILPLSTTQLELTSAILTNILFATIIGLILHKFPAIGMGGADFMAFIIIGFLLPTTPQLGPLPFITPPELPFPSSLITLEFMTVIVNTGFLIMLYLPYLPIKNYLLGETDKPFLTAFTREVPLNELQERHGRVIATWKLKDASLTEKIRVYFTGLDTFFLQDYLKWRKEVSDESVETLADENTEHLEYFMDTYQDVLEEEEKWGSDDIESDAKFLENLVQQETVRMMPGLPFIVPLFGGVIVSVTIGDLMLLVLLFVNGLL